MRHIFISLAVMVALVLGTLPAQSQANGKITVQVMGLRNDNGVVHAALRGFEINDLAFSHSARGHIAHSDDFQTPIASRFCDNRADFRSANLKAYKDVVSSHSLESPLPGAPAEPGAKIAPRLSQSPRAEEPKIVPP